MKSKEPIYSFDVTHEGKAKRVQIRRPTRSQQVDADMYHAIKFSEYVKLGLLTVEQIAKRQIDIGGVFTEEQQKTYARLQSSMTEKQEMLFRLMQKSDLSDDELSRKRGLAEDIAILRSQISDFEYLKTSVYDLTANVKARNDLILWYILALTQVADVKEESDKIEFLPMFKGDDHKTRVSRLEEMEDNDDQVLMESYDTLVKIVTFWFWMGVNDRGQLAQLLDQSKGGKPAVTPPVATSNGDEQPTSQ